MSRLLIIDDSLELLEAMEYFLEEKGYEVKCLSNPDELFPSILAFLPDLIILDIFLHGNDGREICKRLRETATGRQLCIILFSASPKEGDKFREYGADGFLEKPFALRDLTTAIDSAIHHCKTVYGS